MKITNIFIMTLVIGFVCGTASAQNQPAPAKSPRVTHRQMNQQARITQGVKSGKLTKGEARKLEKEQGKIQHDKKAAKADGTVTPHERKHLLREQNKASRDIKKLKANEIERDKK